MKSFVRLCVLTAALLTSPVLTGSALDSAHADEPVKLGNSDFGASQYLTRIQKSFVPWTVTHMDGYANGLSTAGFAS